MVSDKKDLALITHLYFIEVNNRINQKLETFAVFLDLKKAFDSVQRDFLLYKLNKIGIDGNVLLNQKPL